MIFSLLVYFLLPSLILSSPFGAEHNLCYNVTGDQVELPVIKFPSKFKVKFSKLIPYNLSEVRATKVQRFWVGTERFRSTQPFSNTTGICERILIECWVIFFNETSKSRIRLILQFRKSFKTGQDIRKQITKCSKRSNTFILTFILYYNLCQSIIFTIQRT